VSISATGRARRAAAALNCQLSCPGGLASYASARRCGTAGGRPGRDPRMLVAALDRRVRRGLGHRARAGEDIQGPRRRAHPAPQVAPHCLHRAGRSRLVLPIARQGRADPAHWWRTRPPAPTKPCTPSSGSGWASRWPTQSFPTTPSSSQVATLPTKALAAYAEVLDALQLTPWNGEPHHEGNPDAPVRRWHFGANLAGQVTYLVLEDQREVHLLLVQWLDDAPATVTDLSARHRSRHWVYRKHIPCGTGRTRRRRYVRAPVAVPLAVIDSMGAGRTRRRCSTPGRRSECGRRDELRRGPAPSPPLLRSASSARRSAWVARRTSA